MPRIETQQVCLNGHQITAIYNSSPESRKNFCTTCSETTIHKCPDCHNDFKRYTIHEGAGVISPFGTFVPDICQFCGKDFPWREKKKKINEVSKTSEERDDASLVNLLCEKFHLVAKQMRHRHANRSTININDEYDVQDLLHSLLKIYFDDIRAEEWNPSYGGKSTRADFLLKNEKIVIEVKKTRINLKTKEIAEQLIIDIAHYKQNSDCKTLHCFVYDPEGHISNPKGIQNDLTKTEKDFRVIVNIIPRGH